jgi:molybdopterin-binding protein
VGDVELYKLQGVEFERRGHFRLAIDDFTLSGGDKVAIIGRNGAGKTTLLRLLAFLEQPTRTESFHFRGRSVSSRGIDRKGLGFLKQLPYLFQGSVSDNLAYPLKLQGKARDTIKPRVDEILNLVDLQELADADATRLSGGEGKRLALGRALISRPEILLLDEPVAHLDRRSRRVIERVLIESEATILFTTHDLHLAYKIADRVLNLTAGRIAEGLPENVLTGQIDGDDLITEGGIRIHLAGAAVANGLGKQTIMLDPRHLVISNETLRSSMRNHFEGRVITAREQRQNVWLEIDCGELLTAIISHESYIELGINLNKTVTVSFKASALEVL